MNIGLGACRSTTTRSRVRTRCGSTRSCSTRRSRPARATRRCGSATISSSTSRSTAVRPSATACTSRSSRWPRSAVSCPTCDSARSCCSKRCVRRRCSPRRSRRSTSSRVVASTSASARAGTSPSTTRSVRRCRSPVCASTRLREAVDVVTGLLGGGPLDYDGRPSPGRRRGESPAALQQPRPRVFVGGKGDRLLAARRASAPTVGTRAGRGRRPTIASGSTVLEAACERVGRDPASVWRTLGLYALCGEDQADLERRFERLKAATPAGRPRRRLARAVAQGPSRRDGSGSSRAGRRVGKPRRGDHHRRRRRPAVPGGRSRRRLDARPGPGAVTDHTPRLVACDSQRPPERCRTCPSVPRN